jgi:cell division protein FtsN
VTRVRVGPFNGRDAAEKERVRMKSLGFDGNVAPK